MWRGFTRVPESSPTQVRQKEHLDVPVCKEKDLYKPQEFSGQGPHFHAPFQTPRRSPGNGSCGSKFTTVESFNTIKTTIFFLSNFPSVTLPFVPDGVHSAINKWMGKDNLQGGHQKYTSKGVHRSQGTLSKETSGKWEPVCQNSHCHS